MLKYIHTCTSCSEPHITSHHITSRHVKRKFCVWAKVVKSLPNTNSTGQLKSQTARLSQHWQNYSFASIARCWPNQSLFSYQVKYCQIDYCSDGNQKHLHYGKPLTKQWKFTLCTLCMFLHEFAVIKYTVRHYWHIAGNGIVSLRMMHHL